MQFLTYLERNNRGSHRTMVRRINNHVTLGPSMNEKHFRKIKGKGRTNLYEFKTGAGDRLLCCYRSGQTVLLNGFHKGALAKQEFDRAARWCNAILKMEATNGNA